MKPPCFNSEEEFALWDDARRKAQEDVSPCFDCTVRYMHEMQRAGRCNPAQAKEAICAMPTKGRIADRVSAALKPEWVAGGEIAAQLGSSIQVVNAALASLLKRGMAERASDTAGRVKYLWRLPA